MIKNANTTTVLINIIKYNNYNIADNAKNKQ